MKRLLLMLCMIPLCVGTLFAQEVSVSTTNYVELIVAEGSTEFSCSVQTNDKKPIIVDWGDGKTESIATLSSYYGTNINHTYSTATAHGLIVKIDATDLSALKLNWNSKNLSGIGKFFAPELKEFDMGLSSFTLNDSKELDFTHCPKLEYLSIQNTSIVPKLDGLTNLKRIAIRSYFDKKSKLYAQLNVPVLDLSASTLTSLTDLRITSQKIDKIILPSEPMPKLTSLSLEQNELMRAENLSTITANKDLTDIDVSGNYLGFNDLPVKNPAVSYQDYDYNTTYKVNQKNYIIQKEWVKDNQIDLSCLMGIPDPYANTTTDSKISWFRADTKAAIPEENYTITNGITTFDAKAFPEGKEEMEVFAKLTNSLFPGIGMTGFLATLPVTVKKTAPAPTGQSVTYTKSYENGDIAVSVSREDGTVIESGSLVEKKTKLKLKATVLKGDYTLKSFKISWSDDVGPLSDVLYISDYDLVDGSYVKQWTMDEYPVKIELFYNLPAPKKAKLTILPSENGTIEVEQEGAFLKDGAEVAVGSAITVRAMPKEGGFEVVSITIGSKVYQGDELPRNGFGVAVLEGIVINEPTTISALFQAIPLPQHKVTYSFPDQIASYITVKANNKDLASGALVDEGTDVVFTYTKGNNKWDIESWVLDGKEVANTKGQSIYVLNVTKDSEVSVKIFNEAATVTTDLISVCLLDNGNTLEVNGLPEAAFVRIYDLQGRELIATQRHQIDVSNLPNGNYIVSTEQVRLRFMK